MLLLNKFFANYITSNTLYLFNNKSPPYMDYFIGEHKYLTLQKDGDLYRVCEYFINISSIGVVSISVDNRLSTRLDHYYGIKVRFTDLPDYDAPDSNARVTFAFPVKNDKIIKLCNFINAIKP